MLYQKKRVVISAVQWLGTQESVIALTTFLGPVPIEPIFNLGGEAIIAINDSVAWKMDVTDWLLKKGDGSIAGIMIDGVFNSIYEPLDVG